MKRLAKIFGAIAGIAAVIWAMRDRFISVAISREPQPPSFRVPAPAEEAPVDVIDGIGPVFARRLSEAGIPTVSRLAQASPDAVAEAAGVSAARARSWIEQASGRV
ncbi:MAG: helix-hairpin-helix domain-containing protein [Actinomycetes bacterium]|nr:MAG: hypothetical protein DIU67_05490 [Actinomycetota bacterium]